MRSVCEQGPFKGHHGASYRLQATRQLHALQDAEPALPQTPPDKPTLASCKPPLATMCTATYGSQLPYAQRSHDQSSRAHGALHAQVGELDSNEQKLHVLMGMATPAATARQMDASYGATPGPRSDPPASASPVCAAHLGPCRQHRSHSTPLVPALCLAATGEAVA